MTYRLNYTVQSRDPGHTVWSVHSGSIEGDLDTLRGLGPALRVEGLWEWVTDAAEVIERDGVESFTVLYVEEDDYECDMELERV